MRLMSKRDVEELRRLRRWKAEAIEVLNRWDEVAELVPRKHMPLGEFKSAATARYIEYLQHELDGEPRDGGRCRRRLTDLLDEIDPPGDR